MSSTTVRRALSVVTGLALGGSVLVALPSSALASSPPTASISSVSANTGKVAGGLTVTVNGSNFSHVSKVEFGTTSGTKLHVVSTHKLTIVSPKHAAGAVDVRVVTKLGSTSKTSATRTADHFTYFNPPVVTAVSPTTGAAAGGNTVTVSGSGFTKITKVEFNTSTAAHLKVLSSTKLTVTAPARGAGLTDIHVYGAYGTSATTTHDRYTFALPTVSAVTAKAGDPAGGNIVTITGVSFNGVSKVVFGATTAHIDTSSTTKLTVTVPAHAIGTVDVRVTATFGTSAATSKDRYTYAPDFNQVSLAGTFDATGVSCVSASFCFAVGGGGSAAAAQWTEYTNSAWTTPVAIPSLLDAETVTCLSRTDCIVIGVRSTGAYASEIFGGSTWSSLATLPPALTGAQLFGFSCASASMCLLVGEDENSDPLAAKYNGSSAAWAQTADPGILAYAVGCFAPSTCIASGVDEASETDPESVTYNGSTWTAEVEAPFIVISISCLSSSFCMAVGFDGAGDQMYATYGAGAWSDADALPDAMPDPVNVSCVSSTWCTALGEGEIIGSESSNFNGTDWSDPTLIQGYGGESGGGVISCPTTTFCAGSLGDGAIVDENSGVWDELAKFPGFPTDVSCTSATFCLAVDDFGTAQSFNGTSWTSVAAQPSVGYLSSVSCVSPTDCVALGDSINGATALLWTGSGWSGPSTDITGMSYGSAVSCPSATSCLAVGGSAETSDDTDSAMDSTFNGASWTTAVAIDATNLDTPEYVSCASAALCVAIGFTTDPNDPFGVLPSVLNNGTWTSAPSLVTDDDYAISCALGASWCLAADSFSGETLTTTGGSWTVGTGPSTANASISSLSCSAVSTCVASGDNGTPEAWVLNGTTWTDAIAVGTTAGNSVGTTSCVGTSFCAFIAGDDDSGSGDAATGLANSLVPARASVTDRLVAARRAGLRDVAVARRAR